MTEERGSRGYWAGILDSNNGQISEGSGASNGSGSGGSSGNGSGSGSGSDDGDNTDENVKNNDPEKNKKLAEITMSEQLRETYSLTIKIPKILKGLHTNQWFFMDVTEDFYETNYPTLMGLIADKKFGRYAGFQKGRFFIEKVREYGGIDGWGMEISLNPIAPSLATYAQIAQEAQKALISALNDESKYGETGGNDEGGGLTTMTGDDCTDTFSIATYSFDINQTANHLIGNSSANYATDTSSMSGKEALLDVYNRFSYLYYANNRTCPQKMWSTGTIRGNCADIARLCMCVGQVHGMKIGIRHANNHYYNLVEVDGTTYRFDCCFKSNGYMNGYGGELCNNLNKNGGPWC